MLMRELGQQQMWRQMSLEEEVRLLSMVDILEPLSQKELEELARRAPDTHAERGEILRTPEENNERLYIVKKGRVRVYEVDRDGRERTLSVAEGGTMLGEMVLTGQCLSGVYVQALEPSIVCTLKRSDLEHLIMSNPKVGLRLVRLLSQRLCVTEIRLAELTYKEVSARLASLILRLVESEGVVTREGYKVTTHYTHEQLATMIGSKRVPVTRAFARLRQEGVVETRRRQIYVSDLDALKRMAETG